MGLDRFKLFLRETAEQIGQDGEPIETTATSIIPMLSPSQVKFKLSHSFLARPPSYIDPNLELVADQSKFHDKIRDELVENLRASGATVEIEVTLQGYAPDPRTGLPAPARADIIARKPGNSLYIIEVKTGNRPTFTYNQRITYPQAMIGHATSFDPKIQVFGVHVGEPLLPMQFVTYYKKNESEPGLTKIWTLDDVLDMPK